MLFSVKISNVYGIVNIMKVMGRKITKSVKGLSHVRRNGQGVLPGLHSCLLIRAVSNSWRPS
jgi:hypothetical protein